MNALEMTGLTKTYRGKRGKKIEALTHLDLEIRQGEVFGFLGPNGAGKSTTIKAIVGLIRPTQGAVRIFGEPADAPKARQRVGYLPENPAFFEYLTAREYLTFTGQAFGMARAAMLPAIDQVLHRLDLANAANRPIRGYSKGMVQRLGLAQALLHDPDLYILDEPMSGLDPTGRALVKEVIRDLRKQGKTVFFSTHITADVEAICDRLGILVSGRLQALDTVEQFLQTGITGYSVQVRGLQSAALADCSVRELAPGLLELGVARERLNQTLSLIDRQGGVVELIETRRKDLEQFFLEVVEKGRAAVG